jgi:hypothetical protein
MDIRSAQKIAWHTNLSKSFDKNDISLGLGLLSAR